MAAATTPGALCISEDLPGKRLVLFWSGPAASGKEPWFHMLAAANGVLALERLSGFWRRADAQTFLVEHLSALHLDLPATPTQGRLDARLTIVLQDGTEVSGRLWVRDLDLPAEAKDFLTRIGATTLPQGRGVFRDLAAPRLGFLGETPAPPPYQQRLSLFTAPQAGAERLPEKASPADYQRASAPLPPPAPPQPSWIARRFPTHAPPPTWPLVTGAALVVGGGLLWSLSPLAGDGGPFYWLVGPPVVAVLLAGEGDKNKHHPDRDSYRHLRGWIGWYTFLVGCWASLGGAAWVGWGAASFVAGLLLWLVERRYPEPQTRSAWTAFQRSTAEVVFWLTGLGAGAWWLLERLA